MTVGNAPYGWAPEVTDCTCYVEQATTVGDVHRIRSRYGTASSSTVPAGGIPLMASADTPGDAYANDGGHVYAVALEAAAQYKPCRYRIRGTVLAHVWQDATAITEGDSLVLAAGDVAGGGSNSLMHRDDVDASAATVTPAGRKIIAEAMEDADAGTAVLDLVRVFFNGAEGFGFAVGDTPA